MIKRINKHFPSLDANVILLGIVSFLTDVSSEMVFPILPIFLTSVLGAPVAVVGIIEGIAEFTANIGKMLSGIYSDKIGKRRPFVILGYGLSSITKPFFALATAWPHVLAVRFTDRVGKGLRVSARDAMVADYTPKSILGKAFGYRKMMDSLGAVLGPLIVFFLLPFLLASNSLESSYRIIFALSIIPAALAVFLLFFIKEKEKAKSKTSKPWKLEFSTLPSSFKRNLFVSFIFFLGAFNYAFLILRAQDLNVALPLIPLFYILYNSVYAVSAIPAGSLSDKIGRKPVILLGCLAFLISSLGMGIITNSIWLWLLFPLYGIYMAIFETVQRALIADTVHEEFRGSALGIYYGATGLAALGSGVIGGLLWDVMIFGMRGTFLFGGITAFVSLILFALFLRTERVKA